MKFVKVEGNVSVDFASVIQSVQLTPTSDTVVHSVNVTITPVIIMRISCVEVKAVFIYLYS